MPAKRSDGMDMDVAFRSFRIARLPNVHRAAALGESVGDERGVIADAAAIGRILAGEDVPLA